MIFHIRYTVPRCLLDLAKFMCGLDNGRFLGSLDVDHEYAI